MKAWVAFAVLATLAVLTAPASAAGAASLPAPSDNVARSVAALPLEQVQRVTIGVRETGSLEGVATLVESLGGRVERRYEWNALLASVPAGSDSAAFAELLRGAPGVLYAMPDRLLRAASLAAPNDPLLPRQWGLARIGGPAAWTGGTGSGATVAVLDTGADVGNLDLGTQIVGGRNFTTPDLAAFGDDNGHGTHVAGVVGAVTDNGYGVAGTAPGVAILVVKVLDARGIGSETDVAAGIRWAADNGAKVISMSFATTQSRSGEVDVLGNAVAYARSRGCVMVAAAGNTGGAERVWPAAYDGVVGVAATDRLDRRAAFSTTGTRADGTSVAVLAAPGVGITSLWPRGAFVDASGTSMATPFVSGAAAVVWAAQPDWTATQVVGQLTSSALDLPPSGRDAGTGFGRLRLDVAMGKPMSPDAYEPDDSASQAASAAAAAAGPHVLRPADVASPEWHDLAPSGDTDIVCADLDAGAEYVFWTSELSGGADTAIALYAPDGVRVLAANDDASPGQPWSIVRYRVTQSGRYFVAVSDPRSHGGGYLLSAQAVKTSSRISIRSRTWRPRYRRPFTLKGSLWPSTPGSKVVVEVLRPLTHRYVRVATIRTTTGAYSGVAAWTFSYRPTRHGLYRFRVRYAGDADHESAVSRVLARRVLWR